MTAYSPNPTVTIDGVNYTSETINQITINTGRVTVDEQPRAGFSTIILRIPDGTYPPIDINDPAYVSIVTSNGSDPKIFQGTVSDVRRSIVAKGSAGMLVDIAVTVVGPLARMARFNTSATYAKQFDGDRIAAILNDVFSSTWLEVSPTLIWSGVDPTKTWQTYDTGYAGSIDQPGSYEIHAYNGGEVSALSLAQTVANSALGVLWETADGNINYSDAASRVNDVANNGFLDVSADYISAQGASTSSSSGDLINKMTISYKSNATVSGQDIDSQLAYGLFAAQRSTMLEAGAAAIQQLNLFMTTRVIPRVNISAVTIPLDNPNLPSALRDSLIGAHVGMAIAIPNLPAALTNQPFFGFVEGWTWNLSQKQASIMLTLSDYGLSAIQQAWNQVSAAEVWNTVSTTLKWENATVVA